MPVNRLRLLLEEGLKTKKINYSDLTSINAATIDHVLNETNQRLLNSSELSVLQDKDTDRNSLIDV